MLIELNNENDLKELTKKGVSVIDFNATWCGPCKMLKPVIEQVSEEMKDYNFISVDIDKFDSLAAEFNVRAVPTLFVIVDGKVKGNSLGYLPKPSLEAFIKKNL
ncbi:MAG: thioredoxin family protein [Bacilli bacterium]